MGADGHHFLMRSEDFEREFPDVKPSTIGLTRTSILGVSALSGYQDTDGHDFADLWYAPPKSGRQREALAWFLRHAEDHLMWT